MENQSNGEESMIELASERVLEKLMERISPAASGRPEGLGAPKFDRTMGVGVGCPSPCAPGEVEWLMRKSPVLALARAQGDAFDPYPVLVTYTFNATGQAIAPNNQPAKTIDQDVIFHAIDIDIQRPNQFVGNVFKPQSDMAFALTSGIQVLLKVNGEAKWASAQYFPIRALERMVAPSDPWILRDRQGISADFTTTTGLETAGIVVNITLLGTAPSGSMYLRMSDSDAFKKLECMGYDTTEGRKACGC